ncbi:hypothetical protein QQX09_13490 [Demequina sp. SYSU T00192]|uniref:Lipoprotein n=1 Tax=Demequina litoralis TaxID=3051660 RepID=A0ABT8GCJ4_9MICO|nr:hypothetical protein [Demequina sp. SYSU T00192]MDN4476866.1 hypothetical protein [Demequina sp. SYSU T00192]
MRITPGAKTALVAATAGLLLTACAADTDSAAESSASASADAAPNVAAIVADVNTVTGCEAFGGTWAGGKVAGEGVVAGWEYTCDVDGDDVVETTLRIYADDADLETDLATVEAASTDTAIVQGSGYLVATTDWSHLSSLVETDVELVRELPTE